MSEFFKTSVTWVVDFRYDGRPRRWFKAFDASEDVRQAMVAQLAALDPRATALTKAAVNDASLNLDATLEREERGQSELLSAPAFAEGVAAFREKRAPLFHHIAAAQPQES